MALAPAGAEASGSVSRTGRFSYDVATDTWEWDDEVFLIHGLEPGSRAATTELFLASKHPEDRERVRDVLKRASQDSMAFSVSYRLMCADGLERRVVLAGESMVENGLGTVQGYYLDLTRDFNEDAEDAVRSAIEETLEHRAVIEQAKGILMLVYGLDDRAAFAMLRWWSRNRNVKVRDLAQRLVTTVRDGEVVNTDAKTSVDALLHDISAD